MTLKQFQKRNPNVTLTIDTTPCQQEFGGADYEVIPYSCEKHGTYIPNFNGTLSQALGTLDKKLREKYPDV